VVHDLAGNEAVHEAKDTDKSDFSPRNIELFVMEPTINRPNSRSKIFGWIIKPGQLMEVFDRLGSSSNVCSLISLIIHHRIQMEVSRFAITGADQL
jgi:hypothetical protein